MATLTFCITKQNESFDVKKFTGDQMNKSWLIKVTISDKGKPNCVPNVYPSMYCMLSVGGIEITSLVFISLNYTVLPSTNNKTDCAVLIRRYFQIGIQKQNRSWRST